MKPTGRRVRGYISDLVELRVDDALCTGIIYHSDYRDDEILAAALARVHTHTSPPPLVAVGPGVRIYKSGEVRCLEEIIQAGEGVGWRAATEVFTQTCDALLQLADETSITNHGSLDPFRVLITNGGDISVIGWGAPRLDLIDFVDDATQLPLDEAIRYTAPESIEGAPEDLSTDGFVLGLMIVALATGTHVYRQAEKALLAQAAEAETEPLLRALEIPDSVRSYLHPLLQPWPEDRHPSLTIARALALDVLHSLDGASLQDTVEGLADTGSSVEIELPRRWRLPPCERVLPEAENTDKQIAALTHSAHIARDQLTAEIDALTIPKTERFTGIPAALTCIQEAERLRDDVHTALSEALTALKVLTESTELPTATDAAEAVQDAIARSRGALSETARSYERAEDARRSHQEQILRNLSDKLDTSQSIVHQVHALDADALDPTLQASLDRAFEEHSQLTATATDEEIEQLRQAIHTIHAKATEALHSAEAAAEQAAAEEKRRKEAALQALADARKQAEAKLKTLAEDALSRAQAAQHAVQDLALSHPQIPSVHAAITDAERHLKDALQAADALQTMELEATDDVDVVLDAAATHLQSGADACDRTQAAVQQAIDADNAERDRIAAERSAFETRRHELLQQIDEISAQISGVAKAAHETKLQAARDAVDFTDEPALCTALSAVEEHASIIEDRHTSWSANANSAAALQDLDELDELVFMGRAEAEFAEADAVDLHAKHQVFSTAIDAAIERQSAYQRAQKQARDRLHVVQSQVDEAAQMLVSTESAPLPNDPEGEALEAEIPDLLTHAEALITAARRALDHPEDLPSESTLCAVESAGREALAAAERASTAIGTLHDHRLRLTAHREEEARRHREAVAEAQAIHAALVEQLQHQPTLPPVPKDDAVCARVQETHSALHAALRAIHPIPEVAIDADPTHAREQLITYQAVLDSDLKAAEAAAHAYQRQEQSATALVACIRENTHAAEDAADKAAEIAAKLEEELRSLDQDFPETEELFQQATAAVRAVADAATEVSTLAEAMQECTNKKQVTTTLTEAKKASAQAKKLSKPAHTLLTDLSTAIHSARTARATADEAERLRISELARSHVDPLSTLQERLDAAIQSAAPALADSPSTAARAAWEHADPYAERCIAGLVSAQLALQQVLDAPTAAVALSALDQLQKHLNALPDEVEQAITLTEDAAALAHAETKANRTLTEQLTERFAPLDDAVQVCQHNLAAAQQPDEFLPDVQLGPLEENLSFATAAQQEASERLNQVEAASDAEQRHQLSQQIHECIARGAAAANTSTALLNQILSDRANAARADEIARDNLIAECTQRIEATEKILSTFTPLDGTDPDPELQELISRSHALQRDAQECVSRLEPIRIQLPQCQQSRDAQALSEAIEQVHTDLTAIATQHRSTAERAATRTIELHEQAQRAIAEANQSLALFREKAIKTCEHAQSCVTEASEQVHGAQGLLEESPAAGVQEVWRATSDVLAQAQSELQHATLALESAPSFLDDPSGLPSAQEQLLRVQTHTESVHKLTRTIEPQLKRAITKAAALASILDASTEIRGRYEALHTQLLHTSEALNEVISDAPKTAESLAYTDALLHIEELEFTLAEAQTSLDELGDATSASEAEALLEVTRASIDIAASMFEYAIPLIAQTTDHAIAEIEEAKAHQRELLQLGEQSKVLAAKVLDSSSRTEWLDAQLEAAAAHEESSSFEAELARESLMMAHSAWSDVVAQGATLSPPETPNLDAHRIYVKELTAYLEQQELAENALDEAAAVLTQTLDEVLADNTARRDAIASSRQDFDAACAALTSLQDTAQSAVKIASTLLEEWPTVQPEADALFAATEPVLQADLRWMDTEEPGVATEQAQHATALIATLQAHDLATLLSAVEQASAAAKQLHNDKLAELDALATWHEAARARFNTHVEELTAAATAAEQCAENYPLEAGLALTALHEDVAIADLSSIPVFPEEVDDDLDHLLERRLAAAEALKQKLEELDAVDIKARLAAVEDAVQQAIDLEKAQAQALAEALETILISSTELENRQQRAAAILGGLPEEFYPELAEHRSALHEAHTRLADLNIEGTTSEDPDDLVIFASLAAQTAALDVGFEAALQALRAAETQAIASRDALQNNHRALVARLEELQSQALSSQPDDNLPPAAPVQAAAKALQEAIDEIGASTLPPLDLRGSLDAISETLLSCEEQVEALEARDLPGFIDELNSAIATEAQRLISEEQERAQTQTLALKSIEDAIQEIEESLPPREQALADAPTDDRVRSQRSRASDALEAAKTLLTELEALRKSLAEPVSTAESVGATFDAEMTLESARTHLEEVDAGVRAASHDLQKLDTANASAPETVARIEEKVSSIQRTIQTIPEPEGIDAEQAKTALISVGSAATEKLADARSAVKTIQQARSLRAVEIDLERLAALEEQLDTLGQEARDHASAVRDYSAKHLETLAAKRAEEAAEGRRRAKLACKRAEAALDAVSALFDDASSLKERVKGDPLLEGLMTRIAEANNQALQAVDSARDALHKAHNAEHPEVCAQTATASADTADQATIAASTALAQMHGRMEELSRQSEDSAERDADLLILRDDKYEEFIAALTPLKSLEQKADAASNQTIPLEEVEAVRRKTRRAIRVFRKALTATEDRVELLSKARPTDTEDFIRDAKDAIRSARAGAKHLQTAMTAFKEAQEKGKIRSAELEIEELRGRAWEACQLAKTITNDLTRAKAALPTPPQVIPPRLRQALDDIADIERRLWRAGQRASEARERTGLSNNLDEVRSAAEAAERAIGEAKTWETEIDATLERLSELLQGPGYTEVRTINPRMSKLRRGKDATPAPAPPRKPPSSTESPTEALLNRMRRGKKRGETGRERLKRLRAQRKEQERQLARESDFLSLSDFEEFQKTQVAAPTPKRQPLAKSKRRARKASPAPHIPGGRAATPPPDPSGVSTQMYTREMLNAIVEEHRSEKQAADRDEEDES